MKDPPPIRQFTMWFTARSPQGGWPKTGPPYDRGNSLCRRDRIVFSSLWDLFVPTLTITIGGARIVAGLAIGANHHESLKRGLMLMHLAVLEPLHMFACQLYAACSLGWKRLQVP